MTYYCVKSDWNILELDTAILFCKTERELDIAKQKGGILDQNVMMWKKENKS